MTTNSPPPPTESLHEPLAGGYHPVDGAYSELLTDTGEIRPAWQGVVNGLEQLGAKAINRRWSAAQRVIQENGVTYNVYGDPRGMHRPWALDPVPMVISSEEWAQLEPSLVQRAHLLNTILADLYSQRSLLTSRSMPAELVFANPGFLRPCVGLTPLGGKYLTLLAFDLARNADGQWWVINDRTQAPSGAGYALENRLIISRTFPDLFRECRVNRLAQFFSRLRESLAKISPHRSDNPHIVVLTPGPYNETYFEHAYLSRYLGFTLVEGADLTVRDNKVYLKTLSGLQRVDVILRRLDDSFCDPLELRHDSALGVAGLTQAVAAKQVAIANALGSGLVETQAVMPFLPALCRELLGEELKLPSVATWWCGQANELKYVLDNLRALVIKPAFLGDATAPVFGATLSDAQLIDMRKRIKANPRRFVAQESVTMSTVPAWHDSGLTARHMMLRVFVAATEDGYIVMPGGLARASGARDSRIVTMQQGGGSKDTWVMTEQPGGSFSLLQPDSKPVAIRRSGTSLPSRVADSLYWLGRYVERADGVTQLMRAIFARLTEETVPQGSPELPKLIRALSTLTHRAPDEPLGGDPLAELDRVSAFLASVAFDLDKPGSLRADVERARQLGSIVRDRISLDTWRVIGQIDRTMHDVHPATTDPTAILEMLDRLVIPMAAFAGLSAESMTHGHGLRFLDMGRRIERATATVVLLRRLLVEPDDQETAVLDALLTIAGSQMTYRSRYRRSVAALPVLDLLLLDESNPRSVAFQLARLETHISALPRERDEGQRAPDERMVLAMVSSVRLADVEELAAVGDGQREALDALLSTLEAQLPKFSDLLVQRYLTHAQAAHSLAPISETAQPVDEATI